MHEQALAAIEEAQTKKIPVDECHQRTEDDIRDAEPGGPLAGHHFASERGIPVGMLDEAIESRIGVVNQIAFEAADFPGRVHALVNGAILECSHSAADEAKFAVRVVAAALDPAAQVQIPAREHVSIEFGSSFP